MAGGPGIQVQLVSPTDNTTPISPSGPFPAGSTPVGTGSGNIANAAATATMAAVPAKTNYCTGIILAGLGATAAGVANLTITGALGGTIPIPIPIPAGVGVPFFYTLPGVFAASGPNVALVVSLAAAGAGNTNASVTLTGYVV